MSCVIDVILADEQPILMGTPREHLADSRYVFGRAIVMAFQGHVRHGKWGAVVSVVSSWIAQRRGRLDIRDLRRVIAARGLELPTWEAQLDPDALVWALRNGDVLGAGAHRLPLPERVSNTTLVDDMTAVEVCAAYAATEAC